MTYDVALADRIRELIEPAPDVSEKKMFGGLAFLIGGNMAVAASGKGGLLVRIDPADGDALLALDFVHRMVMGGREMDGWIRVTDEAVEDDGILAEWVDRGVEFARTLPAKKK